MNQIIDTTKGIGLKPEIINEIPTTKELVFSRSAKVVRIPSTIDINSPQYKRIKRKLLSQGYVMENHFSFKKIAKKVKNVSSKAKNVVSKVKDVKGLAKGVVGAGVGVVKGIGAVSRGDIKGGLSAVGESGKSLVSGVKSLKKTAKDVKSDVTNLKQPSLKEEPKVAGAAILAPLIPMKRTMIEGLQSKGIKTDKLNFATIVEKFHNEFVSKQNNPTSNYDVLPSGYIEKHPLFRTPLDNYDFSDSVDSVQIGSIVTATVEYFKNLKNKKQAGDTNLTATENKLANSTAKVEKELIEKAKTEQPVQKGDMNKYIKYAVYAIVVALILWFIMKKLK